MGWTQAICVGCWDERNPESPAGMRTNDDGAGDHETCCYCGKSTACGIYIRVDPATVAHPR